MASRSKTVRYFQHGTQPPIYLAGSFSSPEWLPQEMNYSVTTDNEYEFYKEVHVEPGKEYQYKFRIGEGEWWILDESAPTVTDNVGNRNNLLPALTFDEATKMSQPAESITLTVEEPSLEAGIAAEVADSAATLDIEAPTPPISDEEAGRIGFRRMSTTPIPEVATTAAEVADAAAGLDREENDSHRLNIEEVDEDTLDSGASTPWEKKAPLFPHECPGPNDKVVRTIQHNPPLDGRSSTSPKIVADEEIDYNDPSLREFPATRAGIIAELRNMELRMSPDDVLETSPSLNSIAEEEQLAPMTPLSIAPTASAFEQKHSAQLANVEKQDGQPMPEPSSKILKTVVQPHAVNQSLDGICPEGTRGVPSPVTPFVVSKQLGHDSQPVHEISTGGGPNITIQPATPGSSTKNTLDDPFSGRDTAKSTAIANENGRSQVTSRQQQRPQSPTPDRPITPTSIHSSRKDVKSKNFLKAFWRVVFVDWIGGLILRLCGGGRHTLLAISALAIIAPALYFFYS